MSRLLESLGDRLNPILVKEVRQAMRGRYFRALFWFTLLAATCVGLAFLLMAKAEGQEAGPPFFMAMFTFLAVAVHLFIPFYAFISMGSEWDENTFDLLVLSDLRPRQLVYGKLLAVGVLAMLFYSASAPFLAFAFLLRDVDLLAIAFIFAASLVFSLLQSTLALTLSSLTRNRLARVAAMALLAAALAGSTMMTIFVAARIIQLPQALRAREFPFVVSGFLTIGLILGAFLFATACVALSHPEENRSTGPRVLTTVSLFVGLGWIGAMYYHFPANEPLFYLPIVCLFLVAVPAIAFVTEPERLGRRVRPRVPKSRVLAFLAAPFLPGGGRGYLLFLLLGALLFPIVFLIDQLHPGRFPGLLPRVFVGVAMALAYCAFYLGFPSALLAPFTRRFAAVIFARAAIPALAVLCVTLPALSGFFFENNDLLRMRHAGWPIYVFGELEDGDFHPGFAIVALLGLLTVVLNTPRMVLGVREVLAASALRRVRERRRENASDVPDSLAADESHAAVEP